jgi:putative DNA primase/helicase
MSKPPVEVSDEEIERLLAEVRQKRVNGDHQKSSTDPWAESQETRDYFADLEDKHEAEWLKTPEATKPRESADAFARRLEREQYDTFHPKPGKAKKKKPAPGDPIAPELAALGAELTEHDIADAFIEQGQGEIKFDQDQGVWYRWVGTHWAKDETRLAFETIRQIAAAGSADQAKTKKERFRRAGFARGVETFARSDPRASTTAAKWDIDPDLLGTPGGTVDLRTGVMRPAAPDQMITKLTLVTPAKGEPKQWLEFMDEVTGGNQDMIGFLQRWLGYSLTGHTREEKLVFMHGAGGNGKGTLLTTVTKLLKDYAITAPMHIFIESQYERHSTDLAMLRGARMVTSQETKSGVSWDQERLKALTGGDEITARFMRQDNFTFMPVLSLTMSANDAPKLNKVDDAIKRRFLMVPFLFKPTEPDIKLKERLLHDEGPMILQWMIDGAVEWHQNGLGEVAVIKEASDDYFTGQDLIGEWIKEGCELDPQAKVQASALYQAFLDFNKGESGTMPSQKAFSIDLVNRGFGKMRTKHAVFIIGLQPRTGDMT